MERAELARLLGGVASDANAPLVVGEGDHADPRRFMSAFANAVASRGPVFLADPTWSSHDRAQLASLLKTPASSQSAIRDPQSAIAQGWLCIPSGGTSGALKFARHDGQTIAAAVTGFCAHFGVSRVNAIGVLPLHHVSGLMSWMRCALTGGNYFPWDWKRLEAGDRPPVPEGDWFLSLVPTQLRRLLEDAAARAWLGGFRAIFVGGGPAWPELTEAAAAAGLPLSLGYGMTETAAMVAALRPPEFLAGARAVGAALPHARLRLDSEDRIVIAADSLFRGYWPEWRESPEFVTEDLGRLDEHGHWHILGRRDALIITGGKKVSPTEVEAVLSSTGEFVDVAVLGVPDREWGQAVIACYPVAERRPNIPGVETIVAQRLAPHQRPKRYVPVANWPRNAQGKLNRAALQSQLA
jgi:O-succinylbenzoic acid--CoA ligase